VGQRALHESASRRTFGKGSCQKVELLIVLYEYNSLAAYSNFMINARPADAGENGGTWPRQGVRMLQEKRYFRR
jgi:hypothetical protein